jgi:UDP-N-acetylmuramate: L-alanyl-gamma-D-glutamyl-meso-diaminopimelate ligase
MGSLAGLLRARGLEVTGSDRELYPPMSEALERWDIPVTVGFRPENLDFDRPPDVVVIGNAVRPDNPEARAAMDRGYRITSFPDALYEFAMADKHRVVVSGTHGKTTTTSMLGTLLLETGRDPSLLVGGIANNFDGSFREGVGDHFIVEGDEYDTVFFDKTPKFLHYHANTAILTSVEFDHADIYEDLAAVQAAFRQLVDTMPDDGTLVAAMANEGVAEVVRGARCRVIGYGVETDGATEHSATRLEAKAEGTSFEWRHRGEIIARPILPSFGRHNVENALAALVVCRELGVEPEEAAAALARYRGVKRRQELRGEVSGVTVIDDFAHHPTAVRETLSGLAERFPGRRIVAVFEPRSNTSRRDVFQEQYAASFQSAGRVIVAEVADQPIYSATGEVETRFSAERLAEDLGKRGIPALALDGVDAIVEELVADRKPGDVVVTLSNGSFGGIWDALLGRLAGVES